MLRYTASRKYAIIRMIDRGENTPEEVMREHFLSAAELEEWRRLYHNNGINGLRTTKLQNMDGRHGIGTRNA